MNIIQRWKIRRLVRAAKKANQTKAEEARLESQHVNLKEHMSRILEDFRNIGFKTLASHSVNNARTVATTTVIGRDEKIYTLQVYHGGGYNLEPLIKN